MQDEIEFDSEFDDLEVLDEEIGEMHVLETTQLVEQNPLQNETRMMQQANQSENGDQNQLLVAPIEVIQDMHTEDEQISRRVQNAYKAEQNQQSHKLSKKKFSDKKNRNSTPKEQKSISYQKGGIKFAQPQVQLLPEERKNNLLCLKIQNSKQAQNTQSNQNGNFQEIKNEVNDHLLKQQLAKKRANKNSLDKQILEQLIKINSPKSSSKSQTQQRQQISQKLTNWKKVTKRLVSQQLKSSPKFFQRAKNHIQYERKELTFQPNQNNSKSQPRKFSEFLHEQQIFVYQKQENIQKKKFEKHNQTLKLERDQSCKFKVTDRTQQIIEKSLNRSKSPFYERLYLENNKNKQIEDKISNSQSRKLNTTPHKSSNTSINQSSYGYKKYAPNKSNIVTSYQQGLQSNKDERSLNSNLLFSKKQQLHNLTYDKSIKAIEKSVHMLKKKFVQDFQRVCFFEEITTYQQLVNIMAQLYFLSSRNQQNQISQEDNQRENEVQKGDKVSQSYIQEQQQCKAIWDFLTNNSSTIKNLKINLLSFLLALSRLMSYSQEQKAQDEECSFENLINQSRETNNSRNLRSSSPDIRLRKINQTTMENRSVSVERQIIGRIGKSKRNDQKYGAFDQNWVIQIDRGQSQNIFIDFNNLFYNRKKQIQVQNENKRLKKENQESDKRIPQILNISAEIAIKNFAKTGSLSPSNRLFNVAKQLEEKRIKKIEEEQKQFVEQHKFIPNITKPIKQSPFANSGRPTLESDIAAGKRLHCYQETYKTKLIQKQEQRKLQLDEEYSHLSFSPRIETTHYNPETTKALRLNMVKKAEESVYRILSARNKPEKW